MPVLGPCINPAIYNELAKHLEELVAPSPPGSPEQRKKFVNEHYGLACSVCHYHPELRPEECPLLCRSLEQYALSALQRTEMPSVAKANCRSLSELYIKHTLPVFYEHPDANHHKGIKKTQSDLQSFGESAQ